MSGGDGGERGAKALPSPGLELRHYAPRAQLVLVYGATGDAGGGGGMLRAEVGVMLPDDWTRGVRRCVFRWGPWRDAEVLARLLYFGLRMLDERGVKVIVCPVPEMGGLGEAIRDRLRKRLEKVLAAG